MSLENLERHLPDARSRFARPAHDAADDACSDIEIDSAVNRHWRGFGDEARDFSRIHGRALTLPLPDVENEAVAAGRP